MPKYTTHCNVPIEDPDSPGGRRPCGMEIVYTPGIKPPELGEVPEAKTKAFVQAIVGHLMKKHQPLAAVSMNMMEQFLAYSVVGLTQSDDPGVVQFMAAFADYLCKLSTLPVTNEMIVELVTRMGLTMEDPQRQKIIEAMQYVRNFQVRKIGQAPTVPATNGR
jgi:hypothetical protein